jgi:hypothetical protein
MTSAAAAQESPAEHFAAGRLLAQQGRDGRAAFRRAAEGFAALERTLGPSPELCLNLGNAALLGDDLPRAIWAFRRGLLLAPEHARLREHLDYARAQVNRPTPEYGAPEDDAWPWWLPRWSRRIWFWTLAGCYTAAWAALAVWWMQSRGPWLLAALLAAVAAAGAGYALAIARLQGQLERNTPMVVVHSERTGLYTGNGPSYPRHPELPTLYAGMEARRLAERGGWLQIQFPASEIGWVRGADVLTAD